jgi:Virulence protein
MNTGYITINEESVFVFPFNGEIWMTARQIAVLFGVFHSAVASNIRSIYKNGILCETKTYKMYSTEKTMTEFYNLRMIIALAYRLSGRKAELFREWVYKTITFPEMLTNIGLNQAMLN